MDFISVFTKLLDEMEGVASGSLRTTLTLSSSRSGKSSEKISTEDFQCLSDLGKYY
jgi:hypothetical protein